MKLRISTIAITSVLLLVGCQGNNNQEGRGTDRDQTIQPTRYEDNQIYPDGTRNMRNNDGNQNYDQVRNDSNRNSGQTGNANRDRNNNDNNNDRYEVAEEAADRITSEVNEVERAYVLTTNNNAYVAVMIDNDNNNRGTNDQNNAMNNRRGTADNDKDNTMNRRGTTNNQTRNITNSTNDGGDDLISDDLKSQISDIVQSVDGNIDNVYVSSNPDFMDLTNSYINDVNAGRPVRGFFDQMGNMIERIFPQNR